MKKIASIFILILLFSACEDIYNPDMDIPGKVLVVDARIVLGKAENLVKLSWSKGFDEPGGYAKVQGAAVSIIDNENEEYNLPQVEMGEFLVDVALETNKSYRLKINYQNEIYESEFEQVPEVPLVDSIYGFPENRILVQGGADNVDDFIEAPGVMLYADITNDLNSRYYRFEAIKTYQYAFNIPDPVFGELVVFAWDTYIPFEESFNIAGPAQYSGSININKHPLYFMEKKVQGGRELEVWGRQGYGETFLGWILRLHQYSISENAYNFYEDVNSILKADGRIFDPLYVQARNNLSCVTHPENLVLGSFEIAAHQEYRFFVWYLSEDMGYMVKPIPYFYDIPHDGESVEEIPDFWEYPGRKNYP